MWEPRRLLTLWASTACYRDTFTVLISSVLVFFRLYMLCFPSSWRFAIKCFARLCFFPCSQSEDHFNALDVLFLPIIAECCESKQIMIPILQLHFAVSSSLLWTRSGKLDNTKQENNKEFWLVGLRRRNIEPVYKVATLISRRVLLLVAERTRSVWFGFTMKGEYGLQSPGSGSVAGSREHGDES
jgi:hypothetical protein